MSYGSKRNPIHKTMKDLEDQVAKIQQESHPSESANSPVIKIQSHKQLEELIDTNPVVLDIWATWCTPCIKCAPEFEQIAREFQKTGIKFAKVEVEDFMEWTGTEVSSVPTFMFFFKGRQFAQVHGFQKIKMGDQMVWEGINNIMKMVK